MFLNIFKSSTKENKQPTQNKTIGSINQMQTVLISWITISYFSLNFDLSFKLYSYDEQFNKEEFLILSQKNQ